MEQKDKGYKNVSALYRDVFGEQPEIMSPLPGSGSNRQYFRLGRKGDTLIGAYNADLKENQAFLSFSRTFSGQGLPVAGIHAESKDGLCYLLQDLGDLTLYGFLQSSRGTESKFPENAIPVYKKVLSYLPRFQVGSEPDYSKSYPRPAFDRQSMLWDLNYFKYYFLKLAGIPFDEQRLEDDFLSFTSFLLQASSGYFMYRDFQSRNVMLLEGKVWFIDYQGGRRGALQYDVASLLYDAKADIPEEIREELLGLYLDSLSEHISVDRPAFRKYYPGFVLIRIFQAMGAYGFRGFYEKKPHFLQSIPYALNNLSKHGDHEFLHDLPELKKVISLMINWKDLMEFRENSSSPVNNADLTVSIHSFSYRNSFPSDSTPNGGGFVFDCRSLPNPGRMQQFKLLSGKDQEVIDFLTKEPEVDSFLSGVFSLVDQSVDNYILRGFTHLMVCFGCTGGQHRSVYCAETLGKHLREKYSLKVEVNHQELHSYPS